MVPKIFISHSHGDRQEATYLQKVLSKNGASTFLDQDQISAGETLPNRIKDGIEWCNIILVLCSATAAKSEWVKREIDFAKALGKKIIPYRLGRTTCNDFLKNLVYVRKSDQDQGHAQLLQAVFGKTYQPADVTTVFPGIWLCKQKMYDGAIGQISYVMELRGNGQLTGQGKMEKSGWIGSIAMEDGYGHVLDQTYPLEGDWKYDDKSAVLSLTFSSAALGFQSSVETLQIRTGKNPGMRILFGTDMKGLQYEFMRMDPNAQINPTPYASTPAPSPSTPMFDLSGGTTNPFQQFSNLKNWFNLIAILGFLIGFFIAC